MEPHHDIYRKEDLPFLIRRRKHRRPPVGTEPQDSDGSFDQPPAGQEPPRKITPLMDGGQNLALRRHGRRHRHHRSRQNNAGGKMLWIALAAVFGIYAVVLVNSVFRSSKKTPGRSTGDGPATSAAPTHAAAPSQTATELAQKIRERIAAWNKLPDAIVQAQSLQNQGLLDQAEQRLMKALETTPHSSVALHRLAQVRVQQKKYDQARDVLIQMLESDPDNGTARLMLASVLESQTNYPAALAVAQWVLETDPNSLEAHEIAANAYLNTDRKALAIPHLRKMATLDRDNTVTQNKLALAYTQIGEYADAVRLFNDVLAKNVADSVTHYNLAVCYAKQSMAERVVETLRRASAVFGQDFVSTWVEGKDFDPVRTAPPFVAFLGESGRGSKTPTPAEQPLPSGPATNSTPVSGPPS